MSALKSTVPVIVKADVTLNPASIPANSTAQQTITVNGALPGYPVAVWAESLESGIGITNAFCSAVNTIKFTLINETIGAIDPASQTFRVVQR